MTKKFLIILTILISFNAQTLPQTVELDFPKLGNATGWLYTFAGSRVDSINVRLDKNGKAAISLPQKDYRGYAYINIPGKGGGEFILAEKKLKITSPEEKFGGETLQFPESAENSFIQWAFRQRTYLAQQQEWLKAGEYFGEKEDDAEFNSLFGKMLEKNKKNTQQLDDTIKQSKLYSARFLELINFMQRLYSAVQTPDKEQQRLLTAEMENTLNIEALYNSGNLWTDVHTYYPALFHGTDIDSAQTAYANSITIVMQRLREPALIPFLSTALTACERANLQKAQEQMLLNFLMLYPTMPVSDPKIQRMLGALAINKGNKAPEIAGLTKPINQPAVIIFFDSECDHCIHEINRLIQHHKELAAKGYRIISISADTNPDDYNSFASTFPWQPSDRLCDFKGTKGENFKNYGIIGTPMIFVTDKNGIILGKYAQVKETGEILF